MRRLGKVLHVSKSGNIILRLETTDLPRLGSEVCDYKLKKTGSVGSILGPVKMPFALVRPYSRDGIATGRILYQLGKE